MMIHSKRGASSAHRWMACPGSVLLCKDIPPKTSPFAQEGTDAHELGEMALKSGKPVADWLGKTIGETKVTEEVVEHVQTYVSAVMLDKNLSRDVELKIEQGFNLDWLYKGGELFGTNDACLCEPFGKLRLYDLKFGAGIGVEVENNPQLLYYALGALGEDDYEEIEMVIVQPRKPHVDGPVRRWIITQDFLMDWAHNKLLPAVKATEDPNAPLVPGDHCKFCPAKQEMKCSKLNDHMLAVAKLDFPPMTNLEMPSPEEMSDEELSKVLIGSGLIADWAKECTAYAEARMMSGRELPGFKLVAKRSNRIWKASIDVEAQLAGYGEDIFNPPAPKKLRSPSQMEKIVKNHGHNPVGVLGHMWEKPDNGATVAPIGDKRKAIPAPAVNDFDVIEDDDEDFLN